MGLFFIFKRKHMEQSRRIVQDQLGESRFYGTSALRGRRLTRLVEARLQRLGAISPIRGMRLQAMPSCVSRRSRPPFLGVTNWVAPSPV